MPREPILAVAAALVLAAAIAWLVLVRPGPIIASRTGRPGGALAIAALHPPVIGGFEQYDVNADNPFVPYQERIRPAAAPAAVTDGIPPRPEPKEPGPVARPLRFPVAPPGGGDAPRVIGFVRGGDLAAGLDVVLPGRPASRMLVGGRIGRWTLLAIESSSLAIFADETGRRYHLPIGER